MYVTYEQADVEFVFSGKTKPYSIYTMYIYVLRNKMKNEPIILRLSYGYVAVIIW